MKTNRFALVLGVVGAIAACSQSSAAILKRWDFEGKDPFHDLTLEGEKPTVIVDPLNSSNHVMAEVLFTNSVRKERSEVRWDAVDYGLERWVSVRMSVPESNPRAFMCLFQVGPIKNSSDTKPAGFFQLQIPGGGSPVWLCRVFLGRVKMPDVRSKLEPVLFGKWETWVVHFRLSDDDKGLIEVWREGKKVYEGKGRNARPGDKVPLKWGVYIGAGHGLEKTSRAFYDNIVLGDEKSSYEEVTGTSAEKQR